MLTSPSPLVRRDAGSACLQSQSPRAATQLSKAAFAATIAYATIIAHLFLACKQGAVPLIILLYLAAPLAGAALDSKPFIVLARLLLPQPIAQAVGTHGVLSGRFGLMPAGCRTVFDVGRMSAVACTHLQAPGRGRIAMRNARGCQR